MTPVAERLLAGPREPVDRASSRTVGVSTFVVGAVLAPTLILATSSGQPLATSRTYLYMLIVLYSAARLSAAIAKGAPRIASSVFYLFLYVSLGIAPLTQVATGISNVILAPSELTAAAGMVLLAAASCELGQGLVRIRKVTVEQRPHAASVLNGKRVVVLAAVSVLGSAYYIHAVGIAALFANREDVTSALSPTGQLVSGVITNSSLAGQAISVAAGTAPVLVAWVAWTRLLFNTDWKYRLGPWLGWALLTALNVIVNNPISSSRFWSLTVLFGFVFSLRSVGPKFFRTVMILGAVAAIFLFPYADYFREDAQTKAQFGSSSQSIELSLADKDYDQMTMTANAISWVDIRGGHTDGQQLLSSGLFFIPHSVWPGRATDTGVAIAQVLPTADLNQNVSSPLWVEFWVDFGWVGVVVGFVLVGMLIAVLDSVYVRVKSAGLSATAWIEIALPIVVGYEFILLRGPLLQAMARLAALVVCLLFVRTRVAQQSPAPATAFGKQL